MTMNTVRQLNLIIAETDDIKRTLGSLSSACADDDSFRLVRIQRPGVQCDHQRTDLTFEYQLTVLKTNTSTSITIINIYRQPSPWTASQPRARQLGQRAADVMKLGDLNCHGDDPYSTDERLAAVLHEMNIE